MENIKKENKCLRCAGVESQSRSQSCRACETLDETLNKVYSQIYIDSFSDSEKDIAKSLALNMAEVYRLDPLVMVRVGGELKYACDVADVFSKIEKEHIEMVIMRNSERKYPVKYLKSYLRTLLYNSVFEMSSMNLEDY